MVTNHSNYMLYMLYKFSYEDLKRCIARRLISRQQNSSLTFSDLGTLEQPWYSMIMASNSNVGSVEHYKRPGFKPNNCVEPRPEGSEKTARQAYRECTKWIAEDPYKNCCVVQAVSGESCYKYKVIYFQAATPPVKFDKADKNTIFFYSSVTRIELPE